MSLILLLAFLGCIDFFIDLICVFVFVFWPTCSPITMSVFILSRQTQFLLGHTKGHMILLINMEPIIDQLQELLLSGLVPELVEQLVVVLLAEGCLNDCVQVLLGDYPRHALSVRPHFDINQFFACLKRPSELEVEAPAHQDDLNEHDMDHISPSDRCLEVESLCVVRNHTKVEWVFVSLLDQGLVSLLGFLRVVLGLTSLQVGIEYEEGGSTEEHDHQEEEVFEEE